MVSMVLVKCLMRLPEPDFNLCLALLNEQIVCVLMATMCQFSKLFPLASRRVYRTHRRS